MKIRIFLAVSLVALGVMWWWARPDGKVRLIFCDVGQGDGVLITQNNFQMIIDAGPENKKMVACLEKHLPFWDKKIESIIITHSDADHSGGLKEIRQYYQVDEQNIYSGNLRKNDVIKYRSIVYEVVSPEEDWGDVNNNSVVGVLTVNGKKILLMADVTTEVEQKMVWRKELLETDILKVSHHGSAQATSRELIETARPKVAIISVGKGNRFGHPTQEVIDRLNSAGVEIWRTDIKGEKVFVL